MTSETIVPMEMPRVKIASSPSTVEQAVWGGLPLNFINPECLQLFITLGYITDNHIIECHLPRKCGCR